MSFKIIKRAAVQTLYEKVPRNLDRYLEGDFSDVLLDEHMRDVEDSSFEPSDLVNLNSMGGGQYDAGNSFIIYNTLKGMTPYLARDERIWVYFTHMPCLEFTRQRWLKSGASKEKLISGIKSHFFARGGDRSFERSNAISSLWWWAHVASCYQGADLKKTVEAFVTHTDVRAQIIERPTTSNSPSVFSAIMDVIFRRIYDQPNPDFFKRKKNSGIYREWLRLINRHGGVRLFDALSYEELSQLFEDLAVAAEQKASL